MTNTDKFLTQIEAAIRGFHIAEQVISEDLTTHYLVLGKHVGDAFRQLKMVVLFKKYYDGKEPYVNNEKAVPKRFTVNKVVIVTNNLIGGVAKLFTSVDDTIILAQEDLDAIEIYAKSIICVHKNLHRDEWGQNVGQGWEPGEQQKNLMFGFNSYCYALDIPPEMPAKNEWMNSSISISNDSIKKAYDILDHLKVNAFRVVIICPYAQSSSSLPNETWDIIVQNLCSHGMKVFTNCGPKEKELSNTFRLQVPVDIYAAFGAIGATVIGAQSGVIDVMRWLNNETKLIDIHYFKKPIDIRYAQNRGITDPLFHRANTTHLCIETEEVQDFPMVLEKEVSYIRKGLYQKKLYAEFDHNHHAIYSKKNLNAYILEALSMDDLIFFLAVYDSANKYWNNFDKSLLGLTSDLSIEWRKSFIAVVDQSNEFVYELMAENYKEIRHQGFFDDPRPEIYEATESFPTDNYYYVSSHAMGKQKYTKCAIVINGEQYALQGRGLNLVLYSKKLGHVIDSVYVDMWSDLSLTIRRRKEQ